MKGFKLDDNGDVVVGDTDIEMVEDNELKKQNIQTVLGTNKGEWPLNKDEGITFSQVLGKGVTADMARTQVQDGLKQVDSSMYIDKLDFSFDNQSRAANVNFAAKNNNGEIVEIEQSWE